MARRLLTLSLVLTWGTVCGLNGCLPRTQQLVSGGQQYDHFLYMRDYRCGLLQIGPSNVPKSVRVIDAESYAIDPAGTRYGIVTKPHGYDLDEPDDVPYVRDRVYLVGPNGRRWKRIWAEGRWEFIFALETPHGRDSRHFTADFTTRIYNPMIDGPPN